MKHLLIFCAVFFVSFVSFSQDKWKSAVTIGSSYYKGNVNNLDLRGEFNVTRKDKMLETSLFGKAIYGKAEKVKNNEEYLGGLKFDLFPQSRLSPFLAGSYFENKFKGYEYQVSGLLGAKWVFFRDSATFDGKKMLSSDFSISAAGQYDYEKYAGKDSTKQKVRVSIRPKFKQRIGQYAYFEHITFVKLNVEKTDDYSIETSTSITVQLIKYLNLKVSHEYDYVNIPPLSTVKKEDHAFITSIIFSF